jgi:hypothetical protein
MRIDFGVALFSSVLFFGCLPSKTGSQRTAEPVPTSKESVAPTRSQPASGGSDANGVWEVPPSLPGPFSPPSQSPMPASPTIMPTVVPTPSGQVTVIPAPIESPIGQPAAPTTTPPSVQHFYVFGMDSSSRLYTVFLGCLTCSEFNTTSIFNSYGSYGSEYSLTSINNQYSTWGSVYSDFSACNPFAQNPPGVFSEDGKIVGFWTLNSLKPGRISVSSINLGLERICSN